MEKRQSLKWQTGAFMFMMLLLAALLISTNMVGSVDAQGFDPTPTPTDPSWRGFVAAREAVEEEHSVDLTIVKQYTFEQVEFTFGIDAGCDSEIPITEIRPVYFGWIYRITDLFGRQYEARVAFDLSAVAVCDEVTETAAPAPAEGGGETPVNPDLPAPIVGAGATGNFELGGHVLGLGADTQAAMRQSGMVWVKKQLRYNLGDSGSIAQGLIDQANAAGFKLLLGIVGQPSQMTDYDSYVNSYAQFLGEVAALGPAAIEVWNEPNLAREWPAGTIDGARYTQMLAAGYNSIKAANPNIIVISGAPAPTGAEAAFPGEVVNDDRFMQQMAAAGAGQFMDCIGLHYNEGIVSPNRSTGDPRGDFPTRYFGSMLARGYNIFGGTPVCWTELGYLSAEGMGSALPPFFAWAENVTVNDQATWLAEAAALSAQSGRVRLMIVWNVNFDGWGADPQGGYAMIRPGGGCPACGTLGQVMSG